MDQTKKIGFNTVIIFVRLCICTVVGLIASRVILDALGASDYGLYNVVGGIVTLLNVINTAMLSTSYRYITFEIGKGSNGRPNVVFNACFAIHLLLAVLILIIGLPIGEWYISNYLNVDPTKIADAHFVFRVSIATTAISTLFVPYQGLIVALEKFSVNAIIDIITQSLKLLVLFCFLYLAENRLRLYSLIMMSYTLLTGFSYFLYSKLTNKSITKFRITKEVPIYKNMFGYAFWTLFGAVASLGKNQGSAILINFFFGTIVNAAFAVANQVESYIVLFSGTLGQAATPQITKNLSGGNSSRSIKLTCYISKYTFLLMALIAFPVLLDMDFLLGLWLKEIPEGTTTFCKLIVVGGLLSCLGAGIPALVNATGDIRTYQVIIHTFNLLPLFVAFVLFKTGYNQYTLSIIYCIFIFLSAFLKLFLLRRIFKFDVMQFIKISYSRMFYVSIPLVVFYYFYNPSTFSIWGHLVGLVLSEFFLLFIVALFAFDRNEWALIKSYSFDIFKRLQR